MCRRSTNHLYDSRSNRILVSLLPEEAIAIFFVLKIIFLLTTGRPFTDIQKPTIALLIFPQTEVFFSTHDHAIFAIVPVVRLSLCPISEVDGTVIHFPHKSSFVMDVTEANPHVLQNKMSCLKANHQGASQPHTLCKTFMLLI